MGPPALLPRSFISPASPGAPPAPLPSGFRGFPSPLPASGGVGAQGHTPPPGNTPAWETAAGCATPHKPPGKADDEAPASGPAPAALAGPGLGTPGAAEGSGARPPWASPIGKQSPLPPTQLDKPAALSSCLMSDQTSNYETGKNEPDELVTPLPLPPPPARSTDFPPLT